MISTERMHSSWDERLARAAELAGAYSFASDVLTFYQQIASFQKNLNTYLSSCKFAVPDRNRLPEELDVVVLLPKLQPFLRVVQNVAPDTLAQAASEIEGRAPERWAELLEKFWHAETDIALEERFVAQAFLQPVAEYLAERAEIDIGPNYAQPQCPFCGRNPALGTLRPEGDGARRSLVCSFCSIEWQFRRILCPACGETDVQKLPIYTAEQFEHIRVESCDTCQTFIKTIDLTKNGRANPIVDELATIPLTLWAQEKGYTKLETNLLGL